MDIKTEYIKTDVLKGANNIRIKLYYDLGGFNCFTYKTEARGYYISVTPVDYSEKNGIRIESITAFRGVKQLLKAVNRQSKTAEAAALELFNDPETRAPLINYVLAEG